MTWVVRHARILLGVYSVLLALALFSPTSEHQSGAVLRLAGLLVRVGVPVHLVTFDRLEVLMNAAIVAPVTFLASLAWPARSWRDWTAFGFVLAVLVEVVPGTAASGEAGGVQRRGGEHSRSLGRRRPCSSRSLYASDEEVAIGRGRSAVTSKRPGRTQKIAVDDTPLSAHPNIDARVGWLLAMSRLHNVDDSHQDGRRFAEHLGDAGFPASRSLVSRWESGEIPISYEAMTAYETVLGLQVGQISSLTGYIKASIPSLKTRVVRPKLDPSSVEFADRLDELIDLAEAGTARARDWQELGWHLAAAPMVHLRRPTWEVLSCSTDPPAAALDQGVLPTVQHRSHEPRGHPPRAGHHGRRDRAVHLRPCGPDHHQPRRPAGPAPDQALGTARARDGREAAEQPDLRDRRLAGHPEGHPPRRSPTMSGPSSTCSSSRRGAAAPTQASEELAELIAELPEGMRATLVHAADKAGRRKLGYVVQHGEDLVASKAERFSEDLAAAARARAPQDPTYDEDQMLTRLIREALFHRDSERRHLAALLIASSPFGSAVTDELLLRLAGPWNVDWIRARLSTLVRYLSDDSHRMRMLTFVEDDSDEVATPMTQGIGHLSLTRCPTRRSATRWARSGRRASARRCTRSGCRVRPASWRSRSLMSAPWQQAAARWCARGQEDAGCGNRPLGLTAAAEQIPPPCLRLGCGKGPQRRKITIAPIAGDGGVIEDPAHSLASMLRRAA